MAFARTITWTRAPFNSVFASELRGDVRDGIDASAIGVRPFRKCEVTAGETIGSVATADASVATREGQLVGDCEFGITTVESVHWL